MLGIILIITVIFLGILVYMYFVYRLNYEDLENDLQLCIKSKKKLEEQYDRLKDNQQDPRMLEMPHRRVCTIRTIPPGSNLDMDEVSSDMKHELALMLAKKIVDDNIMITEVSEDMYSGDKVIRVSVGVYEIPDYKQCRITEDVHTYTTDRSDVQ